MKRVSRDASLHPAAVAAIDPKTGRRTRGPNREPEPVEILRVHPAVWAGVQAARKPGDRIEVISPTRVIISRPEA